MFLQSSVYHWFILVNGSLLKVSLPRFIFAHELSSVNHCFPCTPQFFIIWYFLLGAVIYMTDQQQILSDLWLWFLNLVLRNMEAERHNVFSSWFSGWCYSHGVVCVTVRSRANTVILKGAGILLSTVLVILFVSYMALYARKPSSFWLEFHILKRRNWRNVLFPKLPFFFTVKSMMEWTQSTCIFPLLSANDASSYRGEI